MGVWAAGRLQGIECNDSKVENRCDRFRRQQSVVVTARENSDPVDRHLVHEAVFLVDSAGPAAAQFVLERFRFPESGEPVRDPSRSTKARSSEPAWSNSKLRKGFIHRNSGFALSGCEEAVFHGRALQQVSGFTLGLDFAPEFDGHDDSGRLAAFRWRRSEFPRPP